MIEKIYRDYAMMSRLFLVFLISLIYVCTTEADQPKS
ncbi:hypothetical protein J812_4415, partial [Acinetobacter baumannii 25977_9]